METRKLTPEQHHILKEHGTERPGSSSLNHEKRAGKFMCAGCGAELFDADTKYESGSGWPSFYQAIEENIGRKIDVGFGMVRTEYHCGRCLGHQGHEFNDGPRPTGNRFCNNGVALRFVPA